MVKIQKQIYSKIVCKSENKALAPYIIGNSFRLSLYAYVYNKLDVYKKGDGDEMEPTICTYKIQRG